MRHAQPALLAAVPSSRHTMQTSAAGSGNLEPRPIATPELHLAQPLSGVATSVSSANTLHLQAQITCGHTMSMDR